VQLTHLFSSDLRRAVKTAELLNEHQSEPVHHAQLSILREQDFGSYEGKAFNARVVNEKLIRNTGKEPESSSFKEIESKSSMENRMENFLDNHLIPLIHGHRSGTTNEMTIAIVSHGVILGVLWRCLLRRLPINSVSFAPEVSSSGKPPVLGYLGGWSNTGYLELQLSRTTISPTVTPPGDRSEVGLDVIEESIVPSNNAQEEAGGSKMANAVPNELAIVISPILLKGWTAIILAVNCKAHLAGLKRTGGGVGSAKYDESQKSLHTFFKRKRIE